MLKNTIFANFAARGEKKGNRCMEALTLRHTILLYRK